MKPLTLLLPFLLATTALFAQDRTSKLILTSKDVDTNSVRVITPPSIAQANLIVKLPNKTPAEIHAMRNNGIDVVIMKKNAVVADTRMIGLLEGRLKNGETNWVGLVLIFTDYNQAKAAEGALRGK